jgi:hypothetical protein
MAFKQATHKPPLLVTDSSSNNSSSSNLLMPITVTDSKAKLVAVFLF